MWSKLKYLRIGHFYKKKCNQLQRIGYSKTTTILCNWYFIILKATGSDTYLKTFITWNVKILYKIKKQNSRSCNKFETFRRYMNVNIFKILIIVWCSKVQMNMMTTLIMFVQNLSTEVHATGFISVVKALI